MRKLPALLIVAVLLAIGFFGYSWNKWRISQSVYKGSVEDIRIGNIGEYTIFNPIAQEKGYFTANGLNAVITEYESGPPAIADLLAGKIDVAVAADFVGVRNIFTNPHLRIVAQESRHDVFKVVARTDHGITNPADLKGKRIGVTKKSAGEYYLGKFLSFNNLQPADITAVDLTPPQMLAEIEKGTLDAVLIFDPHAWNLKTKLGDQVTVWSAQAGQKTFAVLYTTDTFIADHPAVVARYVKALVAAEKLTKAQPEVAKAILAKNLNYSKDYLDHMWNNFVFSQDLEQELLLVMEGQAKWLIDNKLVTDTKLPNYLDFIYFTALEEIKPTAVTIKH